MKYALEFTPSAAFDTTLWVWFESHGTYYVSDRDGIVFEAEPGFVDSNLDPEYSADVRRVPFEAVPAHVHEHDPRDIVETHPRDYPDDE